VVSHIKERTQIEFENRVRRRIFGTRKDEVTGGWRKLHNEELCNFVIFTKKSKENDIDVTSSTHGEMRNGYNILVGKPERKWPLGRPRRKWEANIKIYLKEILWEVVD
jgi:hypothetical protein